MLAPGAVAWRQVVDAGQESKVVDGNLVVRDAELMLQLAHGRVLDAELVLGDDFVGACERMAAACVGPAVREGDFLAGALLEEKLALAVEKEDAKGTVQGAVVDVCHQVSCSGCFGDFYVRREKICAPTSARVQN